MDLYTLRTAAREADDHGLGWMVIVFPKDWQEPPGFPHGDFPCAQPSGETARRYNVGRVLAWCKRAEKQRERD